MVYIISGIFFQEVTTLTLSRHPSLGEYVAIKDGVLHCSFYGVVTPHPSIPSVLVGEMTDAAGVSGLWEFTITPESLFFVKRYLHRRDLIRYRFTPDSNGKTWTGRYQGTAVGEGKARCIVTEVDSSYLQTPQ